MSMAPNLVMFQVLKPSAIKDANGNDQFAMIGMTQDLPSALGVMMQHVGAVVAVFTVVAINDGAIKPATGLQVPKN